MASAHARVREAQIADEVRAPAMRPTGGARDGPGPAREDTGLDGCQGNEKAEENGCADHHIDKRKRGRDEKERESAVEARQGGAEGEDTQWWEKGACSWCAGRAVVL